MKPIEPKILPLVEALNATGILETFSSCEGHFDEGSHSVADVRFYPIQDITNDEIERFLTVLVTSFNDLHSFSPVTIYATKNFPPNHIAPFFVIKLKPFDTFDSSFKMRSDMDIAILHVADIVKKYHHSR